MLAEYEYAGDEASGVLNSSRPMGIERQGARRALRSLLCWQRPPRDFTVPNISIARSGHNEHTLATTFLMFGVLWSFRYTMLATCDRQRSTWHQRCKMMSLVTAIKRRLRDGICHQDGVTRVNCPVPS